MIEVLFQDDHLCIINKKSGHIVHKTRGAGDSPVVLQKLRDQVDKIIYPVHRLDRGTSGCLTFAFNSKVAHTLHIQLTTSSSIKKYTALCRGKLPPQGLFERKLSNKNKVKQEAFTKFRVLQMYKEASLVELELITGRKHQIRRHLAHEAHHIIGDVNYGKGWLNRKFRNNYGFHRLFLHCHFLSFIHPVTGERINTHCDLDQELNDLLKQLQKDI